MAFPFAERLLEAGYEVTGFDRFFFGRELLAPVEALEKFTPVVGDIRDVNKSLLGSHDAVIDLAELSNDASADIDIGLTQAINNRGGVRLAHVAKAAGIRRYIYSSSASVYGHGSKMGLAETDACNPQTEYARSKLAVEAVLNEMKDSRFEPVILAMPPCSDWRDACVSIWRSTS